jgi:Tol biopolymer transport system component
LAFGITATTLVLAQAPRSIEAEFKAAQHTEEVEGDLKKAIEQYRQIVARGDRAAVVRALIRMAECHQKLGDAEAKNIYERIVRDFSDHKDAVAVARGRLESSKSTSQPTLTTQRVSIEGAGRVSPDGRYVLVTERSTNNLALRDPTTSQVRAVTKDGVVEHPQEQYPLAAVFSQDGKQIAYDWYFESEYRSVLRTVATTEGVIKTPRTLYDNVDISSISPTDWSPDGKLIAVVIRRKDHTAQIGMVNVADGSLRVLKTVDWAGAGGLRFSPDASMLAYHRPTREGAFERDVFVIAADGAREVIAAGGPSDDSALEWTPAGDLLVSSDRGGSLAIWSVAFRGAVPTTALELVKSDIGAISSRGLTRSGALFYNLLPGGAEIHVAQFDTATGMLVSPPAKAVHQFKGNNTSPEWSNDGRFLAYLSTREVPAPIPTPRPVIAIQSMQTGQVREVFPTLSYVFMGRWSPDDRLFIARGADLKGRSGIVKIDTSTGDSTLVVPNDVCSGIPFWSSRGSTFFCYDFAKPAIVEVDLEGNVVRTFASSGQGADVSPDGQYLVHFNYDRTQPPGLSVLSLADGTSKQLIRLTPPNSQIGNEQTVRWTPDGRNVVFFGKINSETGMWVVPVDGTQPFKLNIDLPNIGYFRYNAKTSQIAFSPSPRPRQEMWKMENFLPKNN